ncbi:ferritin [Candidatus Aenigmatarchaeota archaeon]
MMDKKLLEKLNEQVVHEFYSSYLYLSMAAYFENKSLKGFAHWMRLQAQEENAHAMKIFNFILERGENVELGAIKKPKTSWASTIDVIRETLAHEKSVTGLINSLVEMSKKANDNATQIFLNWFVTEQIEEESNASEILDRLTLVGEKGEGIFMIDRELAQRIAAPETE